jgi:hypothetical protein
MIDWIQANWATIVQGYLALVGLASWVVKLTPTLKDDTVLLTIIKFVAKYLAVNTPTPEDASRPK